MAPTLLFFILARPSASPNQASVHPSYGIFSATGSKKGYGEEHLEIVTDLVIKLYEMGYTPGNPGPTVLRDRRKTFSNKNLPACSPFAWKPGETYDVVIPFGDARANATKTVWIVDFPNDTVMTIRRSQRSSLPVSTMIKREVSFADFRITGSTLPRYTSPKFDDQRMWRWKPNFSIDPRLRTLGHCLLREFDCQWRHVLRTDYNRATLKVLARAVLCFSTLRFGVREKIGDDHGKTLPVSVQQLPKWKPLEQDVLRLGDTHVVICQSLQDGLSTATGHAQLHPPVDIKNHSKDSIQKPHYVLLSVKGIALCRLTHQGMEVTEPEPLFNGRPAVVRPSDQALDQLLWATSHVHRPVETPISNLPTELQDMILGFASNGSIAAAKISCHLAIGSPFAWNINYDAASDGGCRYIAMKRGPWSETTSQILLDDHVTGIGFMES